MTQSIFGKIDEVEKKIDYRFVDKELLVLAFTHRSFFNENKELVKGHNERLEFLGDSILGFLVSDFLYQYLPFSQEGDLSFLRSRLVDAATCCQMVQRLDIERYLLVGRGEATNSGRGRVSVLADLFEAILGAIYLDSGIESVKTFFLKHCVSSLKELVKEPSHNWKALLQDYFQKKLQKQPVYKVIGEEGPDHEKIFCIAVYLDDDELGSGKGLSKKEAEQQAAQMAYKKLTGR